LRAALADRRWPRDSGSNGGERSTAAFLLYQHAVLEDQEYDLFFPLVEEAFREGLLKAFDYARAFDRHRLRRNMPQEFGTQFTTEGANRIVSNSASCAETINQKRAQIGLEPISREVIIITSTGQCK